LGGGSGFAQSRTGSSGSAEQRRPLTGALLWDTGLTPGWRSRRLLPATEALGPGAAAHSRGCGSRCLGRCRHLAGWSCDSVSSRAGSRRWGDCLRWPDPRCGVPLFYVS